MIVWFDIKAKSDPTGIYTIKLIITKSYIALKLLNKRSTRLEKHKTIEIYGY